MTHDVATSGTNHSVNIPDHAIRPHMEYLRIVMHVESRVIKDETSLYLVLGTKDVHRIFSNRETSWVSWTADRRQGTTGPTRWACLTSRPSRTAGTFSGVLCIVLSSGRRIEKDADVDVADITIYVLKRTLFDEYATTCICTSVVLDRSQCPEQETARDASRLVRLPYDAACW